MARPPIKRIKQKITFSCKTLSLRGQMNGAKVHNFFHAFIQVDRFSFKANKIHHQLGNITQRTLLTAVSSTN